MVLYQVFVDNKLTEYSDVSLDDAKQKAAQHIINKCPLRIERFVEPPGPILIWVYDYNEESWVEQK